MRIKALSGFLLLLALPCSCTFSPEVGPGGSTDSVADGLSQGDGALSDGAPLDGSGIDAKELPSTDVTPGVDTTDTGTQPADSAADGLSDTLPPADTAAGTDNEPGLDTQPGVDTAQDTTPGDDTFEPEPWEPCGASGFCWQLPQVTSGAVGKWPGLTNARYQLRLGWHGGAIGDVK